MLGFEKYEEQKKLLTQLMSTPEEREQMLSQIEHPDEVFDISKDPYNHMLKVIFSRWKPFILRAIEVDHGTYFSRFFKQLPISQKVLSQNLKEMQQDDLISREVVPEVPPRVIYRLTQKGQTLIPLLDLVYDWGWNDMKRNGMPVDILGEMWHGYREPDPRLMDKPFYMGKTE